MGERLATAHPRDRTRLAAADGEASCETTASSGWKTREGSAMVPTMAPARQWEVARPRARRRRQRSFLERNGGSLVVLALLSALLFTVLLFSAWGAGPTVTAQPLAASGVLPGGRPQPQVLATAGDLRIQLPVAQSAVTAIGYHRASAGALSLQPVGRQGNAGLLRRLWHRIAGAPSGRLTWFQLGGARGPGTSAVNVGAAPGTDVYAPTTGTVIGITDHVLAGRVHGARIDIRPHIAPSLVVTLTHLRVDPSLTVGSPVVAATSKLGIVLDLSRVERQALAEFTQDAGDNVALEVRPPATLAVR
jgi:hypothetical protein